MRHYDFIIIGAGIVGLAAARALALRKCGSVCVLEKESSLGMHASGRNSGVLHSGIYYAPDSLKAKVCSAGAKMMAAYCRERGIPVEKNGKVVVARNAEESQRIRELYERAKQNGIRCELVDRGKLNEIEPDACTYDVALYSPETAVLDPKLVLDALETDVTDRGVDLIKNAEAKSIQDNIIQTSKDRFEFGHMINAAGLYADKIAHQMGVGRKYRIVPFKGIYQRLSAEASSRFRGSVYPAPNASVPFLGVHLTKTVSGEVTVGPTAMPALGRENYGILDGIDFEMPDILRTVAAMMMKNQDGFRQMATEEWAKYRPSGMFSAAKRLAPFLGTKDLLACDKVGLRAQLVDRSSLKLIMDFVIERGPDSTHILNAVSPAFTSSLAFAERVADEVEQKIAA